MGNQGSVKKMWLKLSTMGTDSEAVRKDDKADQVQQLKLDDFVYEDGGLFGNLTALRQTRCAQSTRADEPRRTNGSGVANRRGEAVRNRQSPDDTPSGSRRDAGRHTSVAGRPSSAAERRWAADWGRGLKAGRAELYSVPSTRLRGKPGTRLRNR